MGEHRWKVKIQSSSVLECACNAIDSYSRLLRYGPRPNDFCPARAPSQVPEHVWVYHDYAPYDLKCFGCGWHSLSPPHVVAALPLGPCSRAMWQPHPFAPQNQTPAQVLGSYVPNPAPAPTQPIGAGMFSLTLPESFCDFKPAVNANVYRCSRCGFEVPWDDYAGEVNHRGFYPPRDCVAAFAATADKTCADCGRDWCGFLDAYYGRDASEAARCAKCRSRKASVATTCGEELDL